MHRLCPCDMPLLHAWWVDGVRVKPGCAPFAALLGGSGRVWAFDMDATRLARLEANAAAAGAENVVAAQADFLQVDVTDARYAQVRGRTKRAGPWPTIDSGPSSMTVCPRRKR